LAYPVALSVVAKKDAYDRLWAFARRRLAEYGYDLEDLWVAVNTPGVLAPKSAEAVHATLVDVFAECAALEPGEDIDTQAERWACNRITEGLIRLLTGSSVVLDARVVSQVHDWRMGDTHGEIFFFLQRAPTATLSSVEDWMLTVARDVTRDVHERASILPALGRVQPEDAVRIARDLLDASPTFAAMTLGDFGDERDAVLLRRYAARGDVSAETKKAAESAVRQIGKRLLRE
jgi:hypothetical protein